MPESTSRITSKAQTTVPRAIREALALQPGDELSWVREGRRVIVAKTRRKRGSSRLDKWVGYAKDFLPNRTTDEIIEDLRGPRP